MGVTQVATTDCSATHSVLRMAHTCAPCSLRHKVGQVKGQFTAFFSYPPRRHALAQAVSSHAVFMQACVVPSPTPFLSSHANLKGGKGPSGQVSSASMAANGDADSAGESGRSGAEKASVYNKHSEEEAVVMLLNILNMYESKVRGGDGRGGGGGEGEGRR